MTDRSQIEEIKNKLDIITVVGEYLPELKRSGRNHFARCPFHNEKSPSFSVNEDIQRYKCFGCGEAGDVITFVQKMEGIDFPKALEITAKRAGVILEQSAFDKTKSKDYKEKLELLKVNRLVAEYFHHVLMKHKLGEDGRQYSNSRLLGKTQIKEFLIGYAPEGFENLKKFLVNKGYKENDLASWSLLVAKNGRAYDKFRKRLVFPIFNHVGDVVGFSGRVIDNEDIPKYLNSSETKVYKKSDILYGLFQAKDEIRRSRYAVIVEGNVDVPMAHKVGIKNIVAPMGTALTERQLKLLSRYCDSVYFAFDSDNAGEKALVRSHAIAEKLELKSKAVDLGGYGDLDEYIRGNKDAAIKSIKNAEPIIRNLMNRYAKRLDLGTAQGKSEYVNLLADPLSQIIDQVEQAHYIQQISDAIGIDEKIVRSKLSSEKAKPKPKKYQDKPEKKEDDKKEEEIINIEPKNTFEISSREKYALSFLLQYKHLREKEIDWELFGNEKTQEIFETLIESEDIQKGLSKLDESVQEVVSEIMMIDLGEFETDHEAERFYDEISSELEKEALSEKLKKIKFSIKQKEAVGEDVDDLIGELSGLTIKLKKLR